MVYATIISLEKRETARALTLPQLAKQGIEPRVIISRPEGGIGNPEGNIAAAKEALVSMPEHADGVLFMEDDIDISNRFLDSLELARAMQKVVYLYTHEPQLAAQGFLPHVWRSINAHEKMLTHAVDISGALHIHSTQCVWIPARIVKELLRTMNDKQSFDVQLRTYQKGLGLDVYAVLPSPVQHRNDRTQRNHNPRSKPAHTRTSITYENGENTT